MDTAWWKKYFVYERESEKRNSQINKFKWLLLFVYIVYTWQIFPIINITHLQLQNLYLEKKKACLVLVSLKLPQTESVSKQHEAGMQN